MRSIGTPGVPVVRAFHLLSRGRVEPYRGGGHSALIESCPQLYPRHRLHLARVQLLEPPRYLRRPGLVNALVGFSIEAVDEKTQERRPFFRLEPHRFLEEFVR